MKLVTTAFVPCNSAFVISVATNWDVPDEISGNRQIRLIQIRIILVVESVSSRQYYKDC